MTPADSAEAAERLRAEASSVLADNDRGTFIAPAPHQYPAQWNWDSALAAIGLAPLRPSRARAEVELLLEGQWEDGCVPHIVFRQPNPDYSPGPNVWRTQRIPGGPSIPTSGITQPPILATAVRILHERQPDRAFLQRVIPPIERWHEWLHGTRRFGGDLVAILHPWESGMDNSVRFDEPLAQIDTRGIGEPERRDAEHFSAEQRPTDADYRAYQALVTSLRDRDYRPHDLSDVEFACVDVAFNAILGVAEGDLAFLQRELGMDASAAVERAAGLESALAATWNERLGRYLDRNLLTDDPVNGSADAVSSLLPIYAGVLDHGHIDKAVQALRDPRGFGPSPDYPLVATTAAKTSARFEPRRYWRGPVWVNINWLLIRGMQRCRRMADAQWLRAQTLQLIEKHGMYEYYDPSTGEGLGSDRFTWSAALTIDLLERP